MKKSKAIHEPSSPHVQAPPTVAKLVEDLSDAALVAEIEAGGRSTVRWAQLAREAIKRWQRDRYPPPSVVEALNEGDGVYRP
jgi:hypothetical protein